MLKSMISSDIPMHVIRVDRGKLHLDTDVKLKESSYIIACYKIKVQP